MLLVVVGILPRSAAALASHQEVAESALDRRWRISRALDIYTYVCWLFEFHLVTVKERNSERNANFPTRLENLGLRASHGGCVLAVLFWVHACCNGYRVVLGSPFVLIQTQASGRMHENHGLFVPPGDM
jgi:hypothetical protein